MERDEYENISNKIIEKTELSIGALAHYGIAESYIYSLEQRIAELEAPKTCEGCRHRNRLADEIEPCTSCFVRIGYGNYYEPRDKQ